MRGAAGKPVGVDPASAEFLREVGAANFFAWTRGATMLFPNSEEAAVLTASEDPDRQGERLAALYPLVVIKRGAAGCEAWQGEKRWRVAAPETPAIDTTGAGDAFVAAFLAARLRGEGMEENLRRAVAAGSAATQFVGGRP
jgi:sugar/nucleoside kinase (ribokinase family)